MVVRAVTGRPRSGPAPGCGDGGRFGRWCVDGDGQPCFDVDERAVGEPGLVLPAGGVASMWHQVGNAGIAATAHVGGWVTLWATARGTVRLTRQSSTWGLVGHGLDPGSVRARFGPGYAEWTATSAGWSVQRRVHVPPGDAAVLRIDVTLRPTGGGPVGPPAWSERWIADPLHLLVGGLMSHYRRPPAGYRGREAMVWRALYAASHVSRAVTDAARVVASAGLYRPAEERPAWRAVVTPPARPIPPGRPTRPAWVDRTLPWLVVASLDDGLAHHVDGHELQVAVPLGAGGPPVGDGVRLAFAVALADHTDDVDGLLEVARAADAGADARTWGGLITLDIGVDPTGGRSTGVEVGEMDRGEPGTAASVAPAGAGGAGAAGGIGVAFGTDDRASGRAGGDTDAVADPSEALVLAREAAWHASYLVGARQPDVLFDAAYVTQGSAYGFIHGLQGAPRDYALFSVPLAVIDPPAARDLLRVMMAMTSPGGTIHYAHAGRGRCTAGGIHAAPTDLPLFLLWALTEYVWATGDHAFLDEAQPFYPPGRHLVSSARERMALAAHTLVERIGLGPHGLVRVGSGDWADPISAMVGDRSAFHRHGESGFNTGFAAYAAPRAALLLDGHDDRAAAQLRELGEAASAAMASCFTGRWFLRGYDGRGGPIGDDHLFLDGQVWALIAGVGTDAERAAVVAEIARRCDDPSPIGATILDRPHPVNLGMLAPGWDCNGGVWAAINGLLAWAYAGHDPALAWRSLHKQSLAAHATAYPHVWYGIWSGPDAYNGWFGESPGETFVQPATPMQEHPIANANAHAGPLLGLLRVLGVETGPDGLVVRDRGPAIPPWRLRTPVADLSGGGPGRAQR